MKHDKICRRAPVFAAGAPALLLALALAQPAAARDTDVFSESNGQNAYILLDASSSMYYPVYESSIDYSKLYNWYMSRSGAQLSTLLDAAAAADTKDHKDKFRTKASEYKSSCSNNACSVGDVVTNFTNKHFEKNRIYLFKRGSSNSSIHKKGNATADQTDPNNYFDMPADLGRTDQWSSWIKSNTPGTTTNIVDTCTVLEDGELKPASGCSAAQQRLTTDADGWVLLDGVQLPYSLKVKLRQTTSNAPAKRPNEIQRGAAVMDSGFEGMLQAPGYYLSGYTNVAKGNLVKTTLNQNKQQWFFATGNYLNHVQTWSLVLKKGNSAVSTAEDGNGRYWNISWSPSYQATWLVSVIPYPMSDEEWPSLGYELQYPEGAGNYRPGETGADARAVEAPGVARIQLHFTSLDLGEGDHLYLYDGEGDDARQLADYTSADNSATGFWTPAYAAHVVVLKLVSDDDDSVGKGYQIDRFRSVDRYDASNNKGLYVLQSRAEVARQALNIIIDKYADIHWGFYEYAYNKGVKRGITTTYEHKESANYPRPDSAEGNYTRRTGDFSGAVNPPQWALSAGGSGYANFVDFRVKQDNEEQRTLVKRALERFAPNGNTPTQMSLQELWLFGFHKLRDTLEKEACNENMIVHLTDGFPTNDHNYEKFKEAGLAFPTSSAGTGVFGDWDGDGLTNGSFPERYDDISQWMYEHSFVDGQPTDDDKQRVTVHNVAFGARMDILKNASDQTPGSKYLMAGNKAQLIAAFNDIFNSVGGTASFAAPSVSADASNRLVSGSEMYTPSFTPRSNGFWMGNVKKYKWGDGSAARPDENAIYGKGDAQLSRPPDYQFTGGMDYWGSAWTPSAVSADGNALQDDGAGEKMLRALGGDNGEGGYFGAKTYYKRPIYTVKLDANGDPETVEKTRTDGTKYTEFVMVKFDRDIPPSWLDLGDDNDPAAQRERDKLVNFVHGYEHDADDAGNPTAVRDWPLGAIIHSQPAVVDYHHEENGVVDTTRVDRRYVVAGSNDGMLHVFSDSVGDSSRASDGEEVFAFIPADMLPKLRNLTRYDQIFDGVDGSITVVLGEMDENDNGNEAKLERIEKRRMAPTFLIFGERRGGGNYWCLDIDSKTPVADDGTVKWTARWRFQHEEIGQTWSNVVTARLLIGVDAATGEREYRRVAVFSGGYDEIEDNFPEPFDQTDGVSTPLKEDGTVDPALWSTAFAYTEDSQGNRVKKRDADGKPICSGAKDLNGNCEYDIYNAKGDNYGRGIWVVDLEDPTGVWPKNEDRWPKFTYKEGDEVKTASYPILPFSVTWGPKAGSDEEEAAQRRGNAQKRNDMIYSFPATPSVMTDTDSFASGDGRRHVLGVMRALYVPDIYANLWKVRLNYKVEKGCDGTWKMVGLGHGRKGVIGASTCAETEDPQGAGWKVNQLFNTRHTVNSLTTTCRAGEDCALDESEEPATEWNDDDTVKTAPKRDFDRGQKAFNGPSISWGGTTTYFVPGNFNYSDPEHGRFNFRGRNQIATLFYGTGDAEHPTYTITHNRIYSIYDDSAISADEVIPEPEDDGRNTTPTPVTLPSDAGDYTLPVTDDGAVVEISLTDDFQGTVIVPGNVKRLIINLNGHEIEGADGDEAGPDGRPAIRLVNPGTILVLNGPGEVEGGEGADQISAADPSGRGGDAIEGADGGTVIVVLGGAQVKGGEGGEGKFNGPDGAGGSICGLDSADEEICALKDEDPAPPVQEERWFTRAGSLYKENNLMNLTCGEMDKETKINQCYLQSSYLAQQGVTCGTDADDINQTMKDALDELLTDDATSGHPDYKDQLEGICTRKKDENGVEREVCVPPEDDFKGWYRVLDRQGDHNYCSHVTWYRNKGGKLEEVTQADDVVDKHKGEAITTPTTLLAGVLYFTSYQPTRGESDACKSGGNGRLYAMNYASAGSVFTTSEYLKENYGDVEGVSKFWGGITGIPTGLSVRYLKNGMVQVLGAMGDMTVGASPQSKTGLNPFTLNQPVKLIYWKDSNSRRQASLYEAEGSDGSSNSDPNPQP